VFQIFGRVGKIVQTKFLIHISLRRSYVRWTLF
jgi:hypothetical protein